MKSMRYLGWGVVCVFLVFVAGGVVSAGHGGSAHWGYEGEAGPEHWGDLSPEFAACKTGEEQSPVDITGAAKADLPAIGFDYHDASLAIINNGHAIQVNYGKGSSITIGDRKYELLQFHFHAPSENVVNGKPYDMEAHLVHKDAEGNLAVVAVFMKKGEKNGFIQTLWDNAPGEVGHEKLASGVTVNAGGLLPGDKSYYSFPGSLTTPPCTEGVSWSVLKTPVEISGEQLAAFNSFYKMNARPPQPLNMRAIKASN